MDGASQIIDPIAEMRKWSQVSSFIASLFTALFLRTHRTKTEIADIFRAPSERIAKYRRIFANGANSVKNDPGGKGR